MDEMPGMSFGHAGTIVEGREDTASEKIARLAQAGITVAERIEDIPEMIRAKIAEGVRREEGRDFIAVEVDDGAARRRGPRAQAHRGLPGRHLRLAQTARCRSSSRTSMSACCADCAWTPRRAGVVKVIKLYDGRLGARLSARCSRDRCAAPALGRSRRIV